MTSKRILPFVLLGVLILGVFAGGQGALAADTPLVVGVRDDIVNFGYLNDTTVKYYGLEIDLAGPWPSAWAGRRYSSSP